MMEQNENDENGDADGNVHENNINEEDNGDAVENAVAEDNGDGGGDENGNMNGRERESWVDTAAARSVPAPTAFQNQGVSAA